MTPWHGRWLSVRSGNDDDIQVHRPPLVGIIGGIGPLADVRLAQLIVDLDNKRCQNSMKLPAHDSKNDPSTTPLHSSGFTADACHTPYLLYSNPRYIPNNNLANLGLGPSSVDALVDSAKKLTAAGANMIGMACTAAHTWRDEVEQRLNIIISVENGQQGNEGAHVRVLDLLDLTAAAVADDGHLTVGLVEVDGTIRGGQFEEAMRRHGIEPILPNIDDQMKVMDIVSSIKRGEENVETLRHGIDRVANNLALKNQNITAIVFGCTDIAALIGGYHGELDDQRSDPPIQFYDTLQVLAEEIIRISN